MKLKETITEDMKRYMKAKDAFALEVIRTLRSDIKNTEIDKHGELDDDGVVKVVQSSIKKHKEAGEIFQSAGRQDLVDKENRYVELLSVYMPKQLNEDELRQIVIKVLDNMSGLDPQKGFGVAMKAVLAEVGSSADGKLVSAIVKDVLNGRN